MTCDRCGREMTRRLWGPEEICNTCYHPDYHGRAMVAVRSSRLEAVTALVADAGPELGRSAVAAAVAGAAPSARAQKRLLDHVSTMPDALVSGSAHAPGVVARLAAEIASAGAHGVVLDNAVSSVGPMATLTVVTGSIAFVALAAPQVVRRLTRSVQWTCPPRRWWPRQC